MARDVVVPTDALRAWLRQRLPEAAVPTAWVWLPRLPLNANGKVDRAALPLPELVAPTSEGQGEAAIPNAPTTPTAARLLAVWRGLLPRAGLHDNFFDLGGDSIVAMQLASRAQALGLPLNPAQVFEHQSVATLADALDRLHPGQARAAAPDAPPEAAGPLPLTPIQRWFFAQNLARPAHFNQAVCLGLPPGVSVSLSVLQQALAAVLPRHDALRLRFSRGISEDGSPDALSASTGWQAHLAPPLASDDPAARIQALDLAHLAPAEQDAALQAEGQRLQASLDLQCGPLLRVLLADLGPRGQRLLLLLHHLAVDGVSWRVLLAEWPLALQQVLARGGAASPEPLALGPRPPGPRAWAEWLQARAGAAQAQSGYWQALLNGSDRAAWALPWDGPAPRAPALERDAQITRVLLDAPATAALLAQAGAEASMGPMPLLLTALLRALRPWTGRADLGLALESHGRGDIGDGDPDGARAFAGSVGWFTAWFPCWLSLGDDGDPQAQWQALCRQWQALPDQGRGWGLLAPPPQPPCPPGLVFNYLGQLPGEAGAAPGWRREPVPGALSADDNARPQPLALNCWVEDGQFTLACTWGRQQLQPATVQALLQRLAQELRTLPAALAQAVVHGAAPALAAPGMGDDLGGEALAAALSQVSFEE